MTYTTDVQGVRRHRVGYYVALDGIATRLATHNMADYGLSGTYHAAILEGSLTSGETELDRGKGIVKPTTWAFELADTSTVRTIIRRRGGKESTLNAGISRVATSLTLSSGAGTFADGSTVYCGRETITLTTHNGSGNYTCVRGENGSQAIEHGAGEIISDAPRHWLNRRAVLYAVNLDTGTEQAIWAGVISSPPKFVDGRWPVEVTDLMTELNRPILHGWREVRIGQSAETTITDGVTLDAVEFRFEDGGDDHLIDIGALDSEPGYVEVKAGGKVVWWRLRNGALTATKLILAYADQVGGDDLTLEEIGEATDATVRQIHVCRDISYLIARRVMLSREGDGANDASWDSYPGKAPDTRAGENLGWRRIGAAIPDAWVDEGSWAFPDLYEELIIPIDEPIRLFEFLRDELLWRSGGFAYVSPTGEISWKQYTPATIRSLIPSLDASKIGRPVEHWDDEQGIPPRAVIECNYKPGQGYTKKVEVIWEDLSDMYGERDSDSQGGLTYKSKSLWVGEGSPWVANAPIGYLELLLKMDRIRARTVLGGRRVRLSLPWSEHIDFVEGYRFALTDDRAADLEGDTGVTSRTYEVVGRSMDFEAGFVNVTAEEVYAGTLICPAMFVSSWDGGTNTITVDTTGVEANLFDSQPEDDLAADWLVRIYDASVNMTFSATATVSSIGTGTVVLTGTPSLDSGDPPAAGDLVVLEISADSGNTNDDGADVEDYSFAADANYQVDSGGRDGPIWG